MSFFTLIIRVPDGLPLCQSQGADVNNLDRNVTEELKALLLKLGQSNSAETRIESGSYVYYFMFQRDAGFVVCVERRVPQNVAFAYLRDVVAEFETLFANVNEFTRPYPCVKFDNFLRKNRKLYVEKLASGAEDMKQLKSELDTVRDVLRTNVDAVLGRGQSLAAMSDASASLTAQSRQYQAAAVQLNRFALLKKVLPVVVLVLVLVLIVIWQVWLRR